MRLLPLASLGLLTLAMLALSPPASAEVQTCQAVECDPVYVAQEAAGRAVEGLDEHLMRCQAVECDPTYHVTRTVKGLEQAIDEAREPPVTCAALQCSPLWPVYAVVYCEDPDQAACPDDVLTPALGLAAAQATDPLPVDPERVLRCCDAIRVVLDAAACDAIAPECATERPEALLAGVNSLIVVECCLIPYGTDRLPDYAVEAVLLVKWNAEEQAILMANDVIAGRDPADATTAAASDIVAHTITVALEGQLVVVSLLNTIVEP